MTLTSAGFIGEVNDVEWAELTGLRHGDASGFNVSAAAGDRTVSVSSGIANAGGVLLADTASATVQVPANPSSSTRIDQIILRARWSDSFKQLTYRQGTPGSDPKPPALTRDPGVQYEVSLAHVTVAPGQGAFTSNDVTRTNTPPATGFYSINSIAQAPPSHDGALIFYTPNNSLRVGKGSTYVELASSSSSDNGLPDAPANWSGARRYFRRSGIIWLLIDLERENSTSPVNVQLGVLPSDSRPRRTWYGTLVTPSNKESIQVEVTTDGVVRAVGLSVVAGQRLRGSFSFPLD